MKEILVVDDEIGIRELLCEILFDEGYRVLLAENAEQARRLRQQRQPDVVLLDIWMPETDGLTLLKEWLEQGLLTMPVIMMSGHGTIETALEALKLGAVDFLEKPIALQKLLKTIQQALEQSQLKEKAVPQPQAEPQPEPLPPELRALLDLPLREAHEKFDSLYFRRLLDQEGGNMAQVAEKAGLERTHLYRKLKQLGIRQGKKG